MTLIIQCCSQRRYYADVDACVPCREEPKYFFLVGSEDPVALALCDDCILMYELILKDSMKKIELNEFLVASVMTS